MSQVRVRTAEPATLGAAEAVPTSFPALDRAGVRLTNGLRDMAARAGATVRFTVEAPRVVSFGAWREELPGLVAVARYRVPGHRVGMLASVSPALIGILVDSFYGGSGDAAAERKSFSAAEVRFVERIANQVGGAAAASWSDIAPLSPVLEGCSTAPADVTLLRAADPVAVQRFAIVGDATLGSIDLVYPVALLRALPVANEGELAVADDFDPLWRARLSAAVMQTRFPVRTVIARPTLPLDRLMKLKAGDFIPVCLPASVPVTVAGRLLAHGTIGEANGRAAIKISKLEHGGVFQ